MFIFVPSYSQNRGQIPYLIPQTVYVGDRATLTVPLPGLAAPATSGFAGDIILGPQSPDFPVSQDIDLHRIVLERRPSGCRLLIEFSAFAPGLLELPPIEIGGERFAGLRVEIRSIIEPGETDTVLSGPASTLAIPGTGILIYGTMTALILVLLFGLWLMFWGRRHLQGWILKWKRRRLIVSMRGIEKRLRKALLKDGQRREILNILSAEFRTFLSFFSGENCRAMTAIEIGRLPPLARSPLAGPLAVYVDGMAANGTVATPGSGADILSGGFLENFFRRCDELRFSGGAIANDEVLLVLGDLRRFLERLEKAEKGKAGAQGEAA
ncbi:hypothetical protein AGMMS50293_09750 [Spirochaetia bacterium]|nr:hypothetical protein AGMMS50293_09750 [Spirochaetia bacterium]